jgi:hypothetical protein
MSDTAEALMPRANLAHVSGLRPLCGGLGEKDEATARCLPTIAT